jgi:hypothetical protein
MLVVAVAAFSMFVASGALANTVTPVADVQLYALSCTGPTDQSCVAIGESPTFQAGGAGARLIEIADGVPGSSIALPAGFNPDGLACSDASSCIVVGNEGSGASSQGAIVAVDNGAVGTVQTLPALFVLASITCPSAGSCMAVGTSSPTTSKESGVVVPITNGSAGSVQAVPNTSQLTSVACSGVGDCVGAGYGTSVEDNCGMNCQTNVAGGVVVAVTGGIAGSAQPVGSSGDEVYLNGVACVPDSTRCVAVGEDQTSGEGVTVPVTDGAVGALIAAAGTYGLANISCPQTSGCIAVGDKRDGGSATVGETVLVASDATPGPAVPVAGTSLFHAIDCISLTSCTAVGEDSSNSGVVVDIAPATSAAVSTAVTGALGVSGSAATITTILRSGGYPSVFTAPAAGTMTISWYDTPSSSARSHAAKRVLIARGTRRFTKAGKATIKLTLTTSGRKLLKNASSVKLTVEGNFAPKTGKAITRYKAVTLRRH